MWRIRIHSTDKAPQDRELKAGNYILGRQADCDIVIEDPSASRRHAEIIYHEASNFIAIRDLNSTNGTYINRQRIQGMQRLQSNDAIRIGQVNLYVVDANSANLGERRLSGTHQLNRDVLLESLDQHAIVLYEMSHRLNTITDLGAAFQEVSHLLQRSMGIDHCEIVLKENFSRIRELGFPECLVQNAIQQLSAEIVTEMDEVPGCDIKVNNTEDRIRAAMCVPVLSGKEVLGLMLLYRIGNNTAPFEKRDLQLAVAISHQTALTIQRTTLLEKIQKEQQMQLLLRRFLAPQEADYLLRDYLKTGQLPGLSEQKVTILFSDLADSTDLAERLGTRRFATILNNFYNDATEAIFKYGGMVRYLGDGIMAVFIQTDQRVDPEKNAVKAGLEIIRRTRATGRLDTDYRVVMGVSVNTGKAMMGYVGTQERAEFTVLGDTVNVAFRMQEYARPYRVVVGPGTLGAIVGEFNTQRIGAVSLKGRSNPIQIYEILP